MINYTGFRRRNRRASFWNRQQVETLEVRTLPAGNIAVSVVNGVLQIKGDDQANTLSIRQIPQTFTGPWPGATFEIRTARDVSQLIFGDGPGEFTETAINGSRSQNSIEVNGVTSGVNINLHGGNDRLFVGSFNNSAAPTANLPGNVVIDAGAGDDDLRLYVVNFTETTFSGGYGEDSILVSSGPFLRLNVHTGYRDFTNPNNSGGRVQFISLSVNGPLEFAGSPEDDVVEFYGNSVLNARFTARFGDSENSIFGNRGNRLTVSSESPSGAQLMPPEFRGPVFLSGGVGTDRFRLGLGGGTLRENDAQVFGSLRADLGAGNDSLYVLAGDGATVDLNVDMGEGDDFAFLSYNYAALNNGLFTGQITAGPGDSDGITRPDDYGDAVITLFERVRYIEGLDNSNF